MGLSDKLDKINQKKKKDYNKEKNLNLKQKPKNKNIDVDKLAEIVAKKIQQKIPSKHKMVAKQIIKQREPIKKIIDRTKPKKLISSEWVKTGIPGFDELFEKGIPKGTSNLIAGGAGSGKTIMCLQILNNAVKNNEKCLYISLEESEMRLKKHMHDFGWDIEQAEKKRID